MKVRLPTHKTINNLLAATVVGVCLYALIIPFLPIISFWWGNRNPDIRTSISRQISAEPNEQLEGNRLLIPDILVDEEIVTGNTLSVINDGGVWLRPGSVHPNEDGNVVLAGHRFTYNQPNGPLYHLDKVAIGDTIGLRWEGETTVYTVEEIITVSAHETHIEAPTEEKRLTIYTCTPLLTAENRLVIIAREKI